uniref:Uncharacterized protein n=1 Tax=Panagrellus redivivus TaxID=6233 RepID=A0A7E4UYL4_PANRE
MVGRGAPVDVSTCLPSPAMVDPKGDVNAVKTTFGLLTEEPSEVSEDLTTPLTAGITFEDEATTVSNNSTNAGAEEEPTTSELSETGVTPTKSNDSEGQKVTDAPNTDATGTNSKPHDNVSTSATTDVSNSATSASDETTVSSDSTTDAIKKAVAEVKATLMKLLISCLLLRKWKSLL